MEAGNGQRESDRPHCEPLQNGFFFIYVFDFNVQVVSVIMSRFQAKFILLREVFSLWM
jgi:hypothetical protein